MFQKFLVFKPTMQFISFCMCIIEPLDLWLLGFRQRMSGTSLMRAVTWPGYTTQHTRIRNDKTVMASSYRYLAIFQITESKTRKLLKQAHQRVNDIQ